MIPTRSVVWLCARYELLLAIRSRWLQIFAVVFAVLTVAVAGAGYILSGGHGVQDFARTAVSLVQLALLLAPLAALVFGGLALTPDRGAAELLFSQPVPRGAVLAGRVAGVWLALVAAEAVGFGLAGLVVQSQAGLDGVGRYGVVVAATMAITGVFLAIAALIASVNTARRTRALAVGLVIWFAAVVLYDVVLLGAASLLTSGSASRLLVWGTLANPVDAARTGALLAIEGTSAFGAASAALLRITGGAEMTGTLIVGSIVIWIAGPLVLALRSLARADL